MSCLKSLSSFATFLYTVPIAIHPKSGDTSKIAQSPQKENITAIAMIRRLSVECLPKSSLSKNPSAPPTTNTTTLYIIGKAKFLKVTTPASEAVATAIATEKRAIQPRRQARQLARAYPQNRLLRWFDGLSSLWTQARLPRRAHPKRLRTQGSIQVRNT